MAYARPIVLDSLTLAEAVQYVLDKHEGPSTLVVCGTKQAFLDDLRSAATYDADCIGGQSSEQSPEEQRAASAFDASRQAQQLWTVPTLRSLATSRTVKVAFCPDITHLRAYLATHARRASEDTTDASSAQHETRMLAILNLIQLHRPTSAFSALGLNRTFSAAVEAAHHTQSQLIIAECAAHALVPQVNHELVYGGEQAPERPAAHSLWEEEVSILNVTTKSFGAGERGVGLTTIAMTSIALIIEQRDEGRNNTIDQSIG
ncbi:hypothetical protein LTR85_005212 [Meristemomyces frigidus]|nr:hypothetical protein LTR85_005212 [Meristemomyces frigidus]